MSIQDANSAVQMEVAAKIKGMLARGDRITDIAIWFGLNVYAVGLVQIGALHHLVPAAPEFALPPRGPYKNVGAVYGAIEALRQSESELRRLAADLRSSYSRDKSRRIAGTENPRVQA
jgi:hypothetical protein